MPPSSSRTPSRRPSFGRCCGVPSTRWSTPARSACCGGCWATRPSGDCLGLEVYPLMTDNPQSPLKPGPADPGTTLALPTAGDGPGLPHVPGYEILEEIGRGGMGVVYKARQEGLNRLVALKMVLSGGLASDEDRTRCGAEAKPRARLRHPNIVQIHEVNEHQGVPYFALEYCDGGNLDTKLAGTPLPPAEAAALIESLARAMDAAHQ